MREFKKAVAIALSVLMLFSVAMVAVSAAEETSYYVTGDFAKWQVNDAYKLAKNPGNADEYMISNIAFSAGAMVKVVSSTDGSTVASWYPDGMDNHYTVAEAGKYNIYFRNDGQGGEGWHNGFFFVEGPVTEPVSSEEATSEADTSEIATSEADTSEVATSEADTSEVATSEADTSEVATSEADTSEVATSEADTSEAEASEAAASDTTPDPEGELANFYVTGSAGLCGAEWANAADENTQMTFTADETYVKVFRNVAAGTYNFKVIEVEGSTVTWHPDGMGNDSSVTVDVDGSTVVVTLVPTGNASNDVATAEVTFAPAAPATSEEASSEEATSEADTSEVATSEADTSEATSSEVLVGYGPVVLDATKGIDGVEWHAWTWADNAEGHWVDAHGTSAADITFDSLDKNIIFACFEWSTGTPDSSWTGKIAQTTDMTVDGDKFTVTAVADGAVTGTWSGEVPAIYEPATSEAATSEAGSEAATSETGSEAATSEAGSEAATSEAASEAAASDTTADPEGELSNFYVAGAEGLTGANWATTANEAAQMTLTADGKYVKVFRNVAAGAYEFKVIEIKDGKAIWHPDGMGNNSTITVAVDGSTVVVTLVPTGDNTKDAAEAEVTFAPPVAPATSEAAASEAATSETGSEAATSETATSETATSETATSETATSETATSETATSETATSETATSETATSETATSETATSETATSETATSETATSETATSETATSETATSETATSETATSEAATSETATSEAGTSEAAPATTVTVKAAKTQIAYPTTTTVKATVNNGVGATKFATSNKKVAIVNKTTGKVRAKGVGTVTITATNNGVSDTVTIKVVKGTNPIKVKAKKVTVKAGKSVAAKKAFSVSKAKGKVVYTKKSGNKKITVSKAGKITAKKGLKAGKYTIKVNVKAKGNKNYKAKSKKVTVKLTVK